MLGQLQNERPHAKKTGRTHGFLSSRVTTSDDGELLVSEDGDGSVADGACRDTRLPVGLLSGKIQSLGRSTGGKNKPASKVVGVLSVKRVSLTTARKIGIRVGSLESRGVVLLSLSPVLEGSVGQVNLADRLGDDLSTEVLPVRP